MLLLLLLAAWVTATSNASTTVIEEGLSRTTPAEDTTNNDSSFQDEDGWQLISASKTGTRVRTYMKPYPGTKLVAFRGIAILDAHISQAMGLFCDFKLAFQWVDMLESIQALAMAPTTPTTPTTPNATHVPPHFMDCRPDQSVDVVHQVVKLPWPLSKREIVLQRHWAYAPPTPTGGEPVVSEGNAAEQGAGSLYGVGGAVAVHYHSVLDGRAPLPQGSAVVRAESPHTLWRFQAVRSLANDTSGSLSGSERTSTSSSGSSGRCRRGDTTTCTADDDEVAGGKQQQEQERRVRYPLTRVEVQVIVDSKGSIPAWLINQVQRRWPLTALGAFDKLVKGDIDLHRARGGGGATGRRTDTQSEGDGDGHVRTFQPVAHW